MRGGEAAAEVLRNAVLPKFECHEATAREAFGMVVAESNELLNDRDWLTVDESADAVPPLLISANWREVPLFEALRILAEKLDLGFHVFRNGVRIAAPWVPAVQGLN